MNRSLLFTGCFCLLLSGSDLVAQPCTLHKAADVARARVNVQRHEWAKKIVASWQRRVSRVMEMDRQEMERMISPLTPWPTYGQNCPVCVGKKSSMGECGIYRWSIDDPDRLTCKYCGTTYPHPDYPETGKLVCPRMGQTFTYYETPEERAHPDDRTGQYAFRWVRWPVHTSFSGVIRTYKAAYLIDRVLTLAKLYAVTGEVPYAERAVWIMDRFAQVYPNYLFHSYNGTYADLPPAEAARELGRHPRAGRFPKEAIINAFNLHQTKDYAMLCNGFWGAGRYSCSGGDGGTILDMTIAYDLIRDATNADGKPIMSEETRDRIVRDLILAGCRDSQNWNEINNKCGPGRALSAAVGVLFDEPESVRWGYDGFQQLMDRCFHFDGFCTESPSYSAMHLSLMRDIPEILRGYSDPPSYRPAAGERFENLQPFADIVRYRLALESMVRMLAPDRRYPAIGDTHWGARPSSLWLEILTDRYGPQYVGLLEEVQGGSVEDIGSEYALWYRDPDLQPAPRSPLPLHTEWFPGWHVAVLRGPDPSGDTAFYFNGYARHGHRHADTLGILYYADGKELASDRGYIWDDPRNAWTSSTRAHNIVVVDGENQNVPDRHSRLELFGMGPGVQVVQASAKAYTQCSHYQRTCVLVTRPDGGTYAVDFFRVKGGKLHEYAFNSNGRLASTGELAVKPVTREDRWLTNFREGTPKGPFTITWDVEGTRLDLTMLSQIDRLLIADAPGWRSDSGSELNAPPIQQILAERRTNDGELTSHFVTVMAPYAESTSPIRAVRLLETHAAEGALGVEVELDGRTDVILCAPDQKQRQYGRVSLKGRFGFASFSKDGALTNAYLLAGTRLSCAGREITLPSPEQRVAVRSVEGRTYHLEQALPDDVAVADNYLLAGDTGFEIESSDGHTLTVRDYPACECPELTILRSASFAAPKDNR